MKKGIALHAFGGKAWIGGIYYIRNVAYQLSLNKIITEKYDINIFTQSEIVDAFNDMPSSVKIIEIKGGKNNIIGLYTNYLKNNIRVVFPVGRKLVGVKRIGWIPDFQYKYYENLFSAEEIDFKNKDIRKIAALKKKLILSSEDCLNDLTKFFPQCKPDCEVMHFVSYIEPEIQSLNKNKEQSILKKYNLSNSPYICVMNQFWQHKNHIVVLNAMEHYFQNNPTSKYKFVFTGNLEDYRCPKYIEELKKMFAKDSIKNHSIILGFINRNEQIAILKNAEYIIQPSLFEGWGTVVEDAKVLDKTILLSDIPVHREQKNGKCILFDPHNCYELANLIEQENNKEHHDDVEAGIENMKARAKEYSKGFQRLLEL